MVIQDIQKLVQIKIKARDDNIMDQYSRIFMVRMFLVCSAVCGVSWFTDKMKCIVPGYVPDSTEFEEYAYVIESACWIQGVYIYRKLARKLDDVAYYGTTKDIDLDGVIAGTDQLCKTQDRLNHQKNEECIPMTKTFFLQYQYMPFLLGALALLYYVPYMLHRVAANDIIKLRQETRKKNPKPTAEHIRKYFFRPVDVTKTKRVPDVVTRRRKQKMFVRHVLNILVRVSYIVVNVGTFFLLDKILHDNFAGLGGEMLSWVRLNHTEKFDYLGTRQHPKPTNAILPPFGYCEVHASAKDIKASFADKMKIVCEISQHVLYQYAFILLWILIIVGILVSVNAFILAFVQMVNKVSGFRTKQAHPKNRRVYKSLTYREMEYLDYLSQHDIVMHGEVLEILRRELQSDRRSFPV